MELVEAPKNKKPIVIKWVFKVKYKPDGTISKHQTRLVAKGFLQRDGLDYSEVFAHVTRLETVRFSGGPSKFQKMKAVPT